MIRATRRLWLLGLCLPAIAGAETPNLTPQDPEPLPPLFVPPEPVRPKAPPPPPAVVPPPPVLPPPPDLRTPRAGTVPVQLEAEGPPLRLSSHADSEPYLCTTPCTLHLLPGGFTLGADAPGRMPTSIDINVRPPGQRVLLTSGSISRLFAGIVLLSFGGAMSLGGLAVGGIYAVPSRSSEDPEEKRFGLLFGAGITAVGFAMVTGGGLLMRKLGWGVLKVTPLSSPRPAPGGAP